MNFQLTFNFTFYLIFVCPQICEICMWASWMYRVECKLGRPDEKFSDESASKAKQTNKLCIEIAGIPHDTNQVYFKWKHEVMSFASK